MTLVNLLNGGAIALPIILSAGGVLVSVEATKAESVCIKWAWRGGLLLFGVFTSIVVYYQQAVSSKESDRRTRFAITEAMAPYDKRIGNLSQAVMAHPIPPSMPSINVQPSKVYVLTAPSANNSFLSERRKLSDGPYHQQLEKEFDSDCPASRATHARDYPEKTASGYVEYIRFRMCVPSGSNMISAYLLVPKTGDRNKDMMQSSKSIAGEIKNFYSSHADAQAFSGSVYGYVEDQSGERQDDLDVRRFKANGLDLLFPVAR